MLFATTILVLQALLILLALATRTSHALVQPRTVSPWQPASWRILLNLGREPSTTLPDDWGASGARLCLPLEVRMESDVLPADQQDALLGGSGARRLTVVASKDNDEPPFATFINNRGEQRVPFETTGGWKLRLGRQPGEASLVRMWIDVGASSNNNNNSNNDNVVAEKQDVRLTGGARLYLAAHAWRQTDLQIGQRRIQPLVDAYERAQAKLEDQVAHDDGDRRLDGTDPLDTLAAYKDMAGLTLDRNDKLRRLQEAQETLPPPGTLPLGNWPGSDELLAVKPLELFVQQRRTKGEGGLLGGLLSGIGEEYHLMGSWEATPLNVVTAEEETSDDDEEYEYYDDDDDEEGDEEDEYEYYDDEEEEAEEAVDFTFETDTFIDRDDLPKQQTSD